MRMLNEQVSHIVFGNGKVIHEESGILTIQFSEPHGEKHFIYPDAFEKHLKLQNSDNDISVEKDLQERQVRLEAERVLKWQGYEAVLQNVMAEKTIVAAQKKKSTPKAKSKPKSDPKTDRGTGADKE